MRGRDKAGWSSGITLLIVLIAGQTTAVSTYAAISDETPAAQWRKGLVRWDDTWLTPEEVAGLNDTRGTLDQYRAKREKAAPTIDGQLQLANWCSQQHLAEQERAHLLQVLEIDPKHAEARRRLGFVLVDGVWLSRDEVNRAQQRVKRANSAFDRWSKQLHAIATGLASTNDEKQAGAKAKLMEIKDFNAIAPMELILSSAGESTGLALVDALTAMPVPDASVALARLALNSPSSNVRNLAIKQLKNRPQEDFVPALLAELNTPLQTKVSLYFAPDGRISYRHWFYSEGEQIRKLTAVDQSFRSKGVGTLNNGVELAQHETELALAATRQSLVSEGNNDRICKLLTKVTGLDLPAKPDVWWSWWIDKTEAYLAEEKPLYQDYKTYEYVVTDLPRFYGGVAYTRPPTPAPPPPLPPLPRTHSCLVAGTPIWTLTGKVAIEKVQIGDLVLAQDVESGELAYKPVLRTTIRPAVPQVRFQTPHDTITCTGGHLFWADGKGWMRARQFEPGVSLHAIGSNADIQSVSETEAEKAYNLVVADFHSYFVGESKLLSHDITPRQSTIATTPGETPQTMIAVKAK